MMSKNETHKEKMKRKKMERNNKYNKNVGLQNITPVAIDNINKQIKNYKLQKNFLDGFYTVSSLGTQKQEYNKFEIIKSLINIVNNTNINDVSTVIYQCNKI